jgi:hypothetical protein
LTVAIVIPDAKNIRAADHHGQEERSSLVLESKEESICLCADIALSSPP